MIQARPRFADRLEFVQIQDFENLGVFTEAVKDVDAVIHVASPFTYDTRDNEKELIVPAINGVRSVLEAAAANPRIKRVVVTSSFRLGGSKKFAELAAWDFVRERKPHFDLVTLGVEKLNESNAMLWKVAGGEAPLPAARVPFWIDARDLAVAHVEALSGPGVGGGTRA
ncbi:hypothetical protein CSHISOI_03848 [Colletotrichum shisoi]|uniref:3-beta hydroxysteroid dehydrogenase/isomerase domain-containing protein n=1 Tax=Colletotrichum shisoi TaxID=2078593 RepID=A0A5Q4BUP6_9PEZI|nr:hypothetical protein CSHISOI_03848 [Colletotrichum shisoi]